jgi:hypothetical protein
MAKFHERQADGSWVEKDEPLVTKTGRVLSDEDIQRLAQDAGRTIDPTQLRQRRAKCPYCGKRITLTKSGMLYTHKTPSGGRCARSGGRPN